MRIERGSTWNIWDFHVHTPYSRLNNNFGFAPASGDDEYYILINMLRLCSQKQSTKVLLQSA